MGAQQVKEGRSSGGGGGGGGAITAATVANIASNNAGASLGSNCSALTGSVPNTGSFGAGSSIRASRMSKSRTPKESKVVGLNIFTEHNGT